MIRRQLPAYSPVRPAGLGGALLDLVDTDPVVRLTSQVRERYSADEVVLTGSGTQALQLAFTECRRLREPDLLVALPAYSCFDLVTAAVGAGVDVVFYDLDPVSLTPDPESLRAALAAGADVVVVANLFGFPIDWDWIRRETAAPGALVVEDAAQGLGSEWRGSKAGSFGDLSVLSFGRGKGWSGGGGGALLARGGVELGPPPPRSVFDPHAVVDGARALTLSMAMWALGRPSLYRIPTLMPGLGLGETHYREPEEPASMPPVDAAIAGRHATISFQAVEERRTWAAQWRTVAEEGAWTRHGLTPCEPLQLGTCGYLRFPVLAANRERRDRLVSLLSDLGAMEGYPMVLPELPAARAVQRHAPGDLPGAGQLVDALFTLPTHPRLSGRDLRSVSARLESA